MQRRIFGIETEFGIRFSPRGMGHLSPEEAARVLFRPVVAWGRSSNVFLGNGARLYLDVGSHPEYATAECASLSDLVRQDKAGERLFEDLAEQAEDHLALRGTEGRLHLFKNNVDSADHSFGSHENYLLSRRAEFSRLVRFLVPFLVSRQLVVGAGRVHPAGCPTAVAMKKEGGSYSFSQRADYVWEAASSATTRSRPLINTRDEPHADASKYRRLHVIVGDSNMSETTLLARAGMTDVVLRLIEDRAQLPDLELKNPGLALRTISHDPTGRHPVRLTAAPSLGGRARPGVCGGAPRPPREREGSERPEMPYVMDLWERTLDAVESGDASGIDTEIDWAIKAKLLGGTIARRGTDYSDPKIAQLDLAYHDINQQRGLFYLLQRKGLAKRWVSEAEVRAATEVPPGTRAALRGRFVDAARRAGLDHTVDWVHLKVNQHPGLTHLCQDPFSAEDPAVEESIRTMLASAPAHADGGMPPV